jgi:TrmH family RNA methyltransferase
LIHHVSRRNDETIVSTANPSVKYARSLQRRKARYQERAFVVEGHRAVAEAFEANAHVRLLFLREDVEIPVGDRQIDPASIRRVSAEVFTSISNVELPQGVLAVVSMPEAIDIDGAMTDASLVVIADGIRVPGNLGTLMRSAAGAGADLLVMSDDSVDPYNPKVVRAGMGAHFHLPIAQASPQRLTRAIAALSQVVIAEADGDMPYDDVDFGRPSAIVIGGEAFGPGGHLAHPNLLTVRIPLERDVESLNAGVAGSLLVFEAARQRRRRR